MLQQQSQPDNSIVLLRLRAVLVQTSFTEQKLVLSSRYKLGKRPNWRKSQQQGCVHLQAYWIASKLCTKFSFEQQCLLNIKFLYN